MSSKNQNKSKKVVLTVLGILLLCICVVVIGVYIFFKSAFDSFAKPIASSNASPMATLPVATATPSPVVLATPATKVSKFVSKDFKGKKFAIDIQPGWSVSEAYEDSTTSGDDTEGFFAIRTYFISNEKSTLQIRSADPAEVVDNSTCVISNTAESNDNTIVIKSADAKEVKGTYMDFILYDAAYPYAETADFAVCGKIKSKVGAVSSVNPAQELGISEVTYLKEEPSNETEISTADLKALDTMLASLRAN